MTRALSRLALAVAAVLFCAAAWRYHGWQVDDAFISLRYARNLVQGHGLVFNPGERVEGYTNFLWVLAGAAFLRVGVDALLGLQVLSFFSALATVVALARLERAWGGAGPIPAVAWLLCTPGFGYWAFGGMETMAFTALFTAGLLLLDREARDGRPRGAVLAFVLLALVRPDGALLFLLSIAAFALLERAQRKSLPIRRLLANIVLFGVAYGAYFAWRLAYYGAWLPNTFQAKVTGGAERWWGGLLSLSRWFAAAPLLALVLLVPLLWLVPRWRLRPGRAELACLAGIGLAFAAYVVVVGGDFMPFHRFYLPIVPLCALLVADVLRRSGAPAWLAGLLFVVHVAVGWATDEPYRAFVADRTARVGTEVGKYFREHLAPDEWLAVNTAGSLPYASGRLTIDMLGLNDQTIAHHPVEVTTATWMAHRRGWGEYVLSRRPRVILWYNSAGLDEPRYLGDRELADLPAFRFFYGLRSVSLPADRPGPPSALVHLVGAPFGFGATGRTRLPDLGLELEVRHAPLLHTVAHASPIGLQYFELRADAEELWPLWEQSAGDASAFVDALVAVWSVALPHQPAADPQARDRALKLCEEARASLEAGDYRAAERVLDSAGQVNGAARLAQVLQYRASLATLQGRLFSAVEAQQEALRLAPADPTARRNLKYLLSVPFEQFRSRRG